MMARKTLLYLCDHQLLAGQWQGGRLSTMQNFAGNAAGREQFAAFLKTRRDPVCLLTDLVGEDFRIETMPHVRGGDYAALVQRKLEQHFRNTPFRRAACLQRLQQGRRDDRMLFAALVDPALLAPWLDILQQQCVPLAGIHSVAAVSGMLVRHLSTAPLLLLSWEKYAGLRQSYFAAGELHFSRLTTMADDAALALTVATEVARIRQYLHSLSLLSSEQEVQVCVICHVRDMAALEEQLRNSTAMHYHLLDLAELARRVKLKTECSDSDATPLLLHLLARQPPRSQYADAVATRDFRLRHVRQVLAGSGAALFAAGLLWCAAELRAGERLDGESRLLGQQAYSLSQQLQQVVADTPGVTASAADMKTAVLLMRKLERYSPPLQQVLGGLGAALGSCPRIRVERLSWQANTLKSTPVQIISLDGELQGFAGDYRAALDYLERFRQALTQHGYEVQAQTLPPDIGPQPSATADAGREQEKAVRFSLQFMWRQDA